jgi:NAD-dependent deacetylase
MSDTLVDLLRNARRILLFTGAGISTSSGIRDFRGPQGVWKTRQPVYLDDFLSSDAARVEYWDQKLEAWPSFREARPNAAHAAAVDLERADKLLLLLTQNIDGLHGRAGTSPDRLVEIHGSNSEVECLSCGERSDPGPHMESFEKTRRPPICACGGFLKNATVSFGQSLRGDDLQRAARAAEACDLVVALGSSLSVHPAASFPLAAAERGVPYVIVNRGPTDQDSHPAVTLRLEGDVVEIFPPAVAEALGAPPSPA